MFTADSVKVFFKVIGFDVDIHHTKKNYICKLNMTSDKPIKFFCDLNKNYTYHIPLEVGKDYGDDALWTILMLKFADNYDQRILKYISCLKLSETFDIFKFLKVAGCRYLSNLYYVYNANFGNPYKYTHQFLTEHTGIPQQFWNEKFVGAYWGWGY